MKKVLIYLSLIVSILAGLALLSTSNSMAAAEGPTCNFIADATNFSLWKDSANITLAQTFTTTFEKVTKIDVKADSLNDFTGTVTAAIYYEPEMGVAGSTTRTFNNMSSTTDDYEFTFSSPLTVHSGVNYQLVLWLTDKNNTSGTFYWRAVTDGSCYPGGNVKVNTVNNYPNLDFGFQVYGTNDAVVPPAQTPDQSGTTSTAPSTNVSSAIKAPTTLQAEYSSDVTKKGVKLNWKASTTADIDGYNIYRSIVKGKSYSKIGQTDKSTVEFVDQASEASKTYYYVVRAYKGTDESASSNEATLTVPADAGPITPVNFHVLSFTDSRIKVAWDKNPETTVTSYNLTISEGDNQIENVTVNADTLENVFANLKANTEYKISVVASDGAGKTSSPAEIVQKTAAANPDISAGRFEMTTLTWILSGIGIALIGLLILLILRRRRSHKKKVII